MFDKSVDLDKAKIFLKKLPELIIKHAFWSIIILLIIALLIGALIGYNYVFMAERKEPQPTVKFTHFNSGGYKELQEHWNKRKDAREKVNKEYPQLFKKK